LIIQRCSHAVFQIDIEKPLLRRRTRSVGNKFAKPNVQRFSTGHSSTVSFSSKNGYWYSKPSPVYVNHGETRLIRHLHELRTSVKRIRSDTGNTIMNPRIWPIDYRLRVVERVHPAHVIFFINDVFVVVPGTLHNTILKNSPGTTLHNETSFDRSSNKYACKISEKLKKKNETLFNVGRSQTVGIDYQTVM